MTSMTLAWVSARRRWARSGSTGRLSSFGKTPTVRLARHDSLSTCSLAEAPSYYCPTDTIQRSINADPESSTRPADADSESAALINSLRARVKSQAEELEALQTKLGELTTSHATTVKELTNKHDETLATLTSTHDSKLGSVTKELEDKVASLTKDHEDEVSLAAVQLVIPLLMLFPPVEQVDRRRDLITQPFRCDPHLVARCRPEEARRRREGAGGSPRPSRGALRQAQARQGTHA